MLLDLQKILGTLGLVSSALKPVPIVGNIVPGLISTVGGLATSGPLAGTIGGLTSSSGLVGGLAGNNGPLGSLIGDGSLLGGITGDAGLLSSLLFANSTLNQNITSILKNHTSNANSNATQTLLAINATLAVNNMTLVNLAANTTNATTLISSLNKVFIANASTTCNVQPYTPATPLVLEPFPAFDAAEALVYRYRQQQSVNLGSWFVQEQWMNPSLFSCAQQPQQAELDVASGWGSLSNAQSVLEQHWDTWIVESDFEYLASIGINTVRLPIGYWSLGPLYCAGTEFDAVASVYTNAWPRVVRAINWASKYGLGVLVDLHGAPGSQNGQAHSGISSGQENLFNNATNIQKTMNVLTFLTQQLVLVNNVVGIELLNEPSNDPSLPDFYNNALSSLRQVSPAAKAFPFYIHDAFDLTTFKNYVANRTDFVVEDHHQYFVFGSPSNETADSITNDVKTTVDQELDVASAASRRNVVIGEWSCALPGQSLQNASSPEAERQSFCTGQMQTYSNSTAGWSFWSYKTEMCATDPNWCFTGRVGSSLPSTFFSYPNGASLMSSFNASSVGNTSDTNEFFTFGDDSTSLQGLNTPDSATLLLAAAQASSGTNNYYSVNEMLSDGPTDSSDPSSAAAAPTAGVAQVNNLAATDSPASSGKPAGPLNGYRKRALQQTFKQSAHKSTNGRHHRFMARQLKRQSQSSTSAPATVSYTPQQAAIAQGYADGFKAAKTFALFGGSRLGFVGQFISDALSSSNTIAPADAASYQTWFMNGLADGEVQVLNTLAGNSTSSA